MQKYGLIGYPLKHSFSIGYFNEKFKAENIDAEYVNFEIPRIEDFMEVIEENPECNHPLQRTSYSLPRRAG